MKITWAQRGGLPECPYFRRWILQFNKWSLRLHRWYADDDHRAFHDHPHWFYIFVLRGGYTDVYDDAGIVKKDRLRRFSLRFRPAEYKHSVQNVLPNTVTLLITGKSNRRWGFWVNGKMIRRDRYFVEYGHHPCDPSEPAVRLRPDGSPVTQKE